MKNFQSSHGLGPDDVVDNATWPALAILTQQGDSDAKVRNFQSAKGLSVDGIVGDGTWNKMAW